MSECPYCHGNDQSAPCAYPGEGKPGCLRDARLMNPAQKPVWDREQTPKRCANGRYVEYEDYESMLAQRDASRRAQVAAEGEVGRALAAHAIEVAQLRHELAEVLLKDRVKTREINILTQENRTLQGELEGMKAICHERDRLRKLLQPLCKHQDNLYDGHFCMDCGVDLSE